MRCSLEKLLYLYNTSSVSLAAATFSRWGRLFVCENRLVCASNAVFDNRLDGSSRAPTPTAFVQIVSPPTLTEGQARKITPDRAVLARVRSRRYFYWKALRAEAVGCITPFSKVFGIQDLFSKRSWWGAGQRPAVVPLRCGTASHKNHSTKIKTSL